VDAPAGVLKNDSDPGARPLTAAVAGPPLHGSVTLNSDGSFDYVPASDFAGLDTFIYQVTSGDDPATAIVSITVTAANDPPQANGDNFVTMEDVTLTVFAKGVLANDGDIDSSSLHAVIETLPAHGVLSLSAAGNFTYTPASNFSGSDGFTYRVSDNSATSVPATVSINVVAVNDRPVAADDRLTRYDDHSVEIAVFDLLANDSDADGDALSVLLVAGSGPSHGTLTPLADGSGWTYVPEPDFDGSDSFAYQVSDGQTLSGIATVTLRPVNEPPSFIAGADQHATDESGPQSFAGWATHISAGPPNEADQVLHFLVTADKPELFTAKPTIDPTGQLLFTPAPNMSGTATVTVTLVDDGGTADGGIDSSQPQVFQITIDKPHPLHNTSNPIDSNNDGFMAPNDVVLVVNYVNAHPVSGAQGSGEAGADEHNYVDVNGDGFVSAMDALSIINYLNAHPTAAGEATASIVRAGSGGSGDAAANDLLALLAADNVMQAVSKRRN
jgi:hypothetical protein